MPPPYKNPRGGTISHSNGTTPYIGHSGAWGESRQNDFSFVDCHGAITTDWVWVPDKIPGTQTDDPLDEPPAEIIVHEQCEASYSGWFFLGGLADGDCDNGLGFVPEEHFDPWYMPSEEGDVLIGYTFSGLAKGTRYKKQAGLSEFSVTCSPLAWSAIQSGMCSGKVNYGIQIINPKVNLLGVEDALFVSPRAIKFITGQNVGASLSLVRSPGNQLYEEQPLGIAGGYQWTIPSWDPFKNYIYGSIGDRIELSPSDTQQSTLAFYSNNVGSGKVTCMFHVTQPSSAKMEGGLPAVFVTSKIAESVRPTATGWTIETGDVIFSGSAYGFGPGNGVEQGQVWSNVGFHIPGGFPQEGRGCFCQLITAERDIWRTVTQPAYSHFIKDPYNATETLDVNFPYPFNGLWILPSLGSGFDSPSQPLTWNTGDNCTLRWTRSKATDSMWTWTMYQPPSKDGRDVTWIPIQKYKWGWEGDAQNGQSGWGPTPPGTGGIQVGKADAIDHPEWTLTTPYDFDFIGSTP